MRRPHKRCRNRVALAKGLAWLLVPMLPGVVSAQARSERPPVMAPAHVDAHAMAENLRSLDALVSAAGTGQCMLDSGLVLCFAQRPGLRAQIAAWIFDANARTPSTDWRLTHNRRNELVVTLQCSREMLAFVSAHVPSIARLPRA
jgi:hypothetical protein